MDHQDDRKTERQFDQNKQSQTNHNSEHESYLNRGHHFHQNRDNHSHQNRDNYSYQSRDNHSHQNRDNHSHQNRDNYSHQNNDHQAYQDMEWQTNRNMNYESHQNREHPFRHNREHKSHQSMEQQADQNMEQQADQNMEQQADQNMEQQAYQKTGQQGYQNLEQPPDQNRQLQGDRNSPVHPLRPSKDHKIFVELELDGWTGAMPKPYPWKARDIWDDDHVYMPYSPKNEMVQNGHPKSRWDQIETALRHRIPGSFELEDAILSYNPHYRNRWSFESLHQFFESPTGQRMSKEFFQTILPKMQELALRLPELCPKALPILKQNLNQKITISQQQAACLLANAFFCTFPRRSCKVKNGRLPDINFTSFFNADSSRKFQKYRCIINYFSRVTENMPRGLVTYTRRCIQSDKDWLNVHIPFSRLEVSATGTIEDDGMGQLQVDFANKYIGGGVLGHGLVQEEIRFLICPEMIVSRLFTEALSDQEVLVMKGCERFSNYKGYSDTFEFTENHHDTTERDEWGRIRTEVVAMDALVINYFKAQFEQRQVVRELNKAYCAFLGEGDGSKLSAVCTGNWGCGAFGGDKQLKALIQMMAASAAKRDIVYMTFGDHDQQQQLEAIYENIANNKLTVGNIFEMIQKYSSHLSHSHSKDNLFDFITNMS